ALSLSVTLAAQEPPTPARPLPSGPASVIAATAQPSDETATLVFFTRPIVSLSARVLGRRPSERAAAAARVLDDLVDRGITEPVDLKAFTGGVGVQGGSRTVLRPPPPHTDERSGEPLDGAGRQAVARMRQALDEAAEARAPGALVRAGVLAFRA